MKVIDWIYNPFKDNICMLFYVPELISYVTLEISRNEDIPHKIEQAKDLGQLMEMLK